MADIQEHVREHLDAYTRFGKTSLAKLIAIWRDIGMSPDEVLREFQDIALRAQSIWSEAVLGAEELRQEVRAKIEETLKDISRIKQQLGTSDPTADDAVSDLALSLDFDDLEVRQPPLPGHQMHWAARCMARRMPTLLGKCPGKGRMHGDECLSGWCCNSCTLHIHAWACAGSG
jgi:hypothetical protein